MAMISEQPVTQAVILAGGSGTRLRPYTDTVPKTMIEIPGTGRPILGHQLDWLGQEGVRDVVISCGHLSSVILEWLESEQLPVNVTTVVESQPLGRGGALKYASAVLPRPEEAWFGLNADIWTRFPLRAMAELHQQRGVTATVALARPHIPWGVVEQDPEGWITDFVEAPLTPWPVNAGVYVFSPDVADLLPDVGDHERSTFPELARAHRLAGYQIPEDIYWRAIDTVKDLETAAVELAAARRAR